MFVQGLRGFSPRISFEGSVVAVLIECLHVIWVKFNFPCGLKVWANERKIKPDMVFLGCLVDLIDIANALSLYQL